MPGRSTKARPARTGVGILPLTVLMVWMGERMMDLTWPWLLGVSAAGIAVVVLGHQWAHRRRGIDNERPR